MQTLLPTLNDLAQKPGLYERSSRSPISSATDGSSFAQIVQDAAQVHSSQPISTENSVSSAGVSDAAHDRAASGSEDAQDTSPSRDQPLVGEPPDQPEAAAAERSTPAGADSVEGPAQNDAGSAQGLPADSAVSGEGDPARELDKQKNLNIVEYAPSSIVRDDAAGTERSGEAGSSKASPAAPSDAAPGPSAPGKHSTAMPADGRPSSAPTSITREADSTSRPDVAYQRQQIGADSHVTDRTSSGDSQPAADSRSLEPTSASTQSPPKSIATDDTVSRAPSSTPSQSGDGQLLPSSAAPGERGTVNYEPHQAGGRAPRDGGALQSPIQHGQPETSQDSRRDDGQSQPRADQPGRLAPNNESTPRAPASARAVQIDAAVRVENATGQPATLQLAAPLPVPPSLPSSTTAGVVQQLPTSTTPTPRADPDHDPFTARILRGLSATLNQRGGVLTMRLEPPELGQLRIQMTITQGTVSAEFQTATPQAQALLERSLAVLRSALQGHGLTVERLTVHTAQQVNTQATRQDPTEQQTQQNRHHADAGKGESRGRRDGDQTGSFRHPMPRSTNEYTAFDVSPQPVGAD